MRRFLVPALVMLAACVSAIGIAAVSHPSPAPPPAMTGPAAGTPVGEPIRVEIPAIGVDEPLHGVGLQADGSAELPDFGDAAWYDPGPRPGEAGPAVLLAHVRGPAGPDLFADLADLGPGDVVIVHHTGGRAEFVVTGSEQVPKDALPYERIWPDSDVPLLRLITCAGAPTAAGFPDNTVVYADLR